MKQKKQAGSENGRLRERYEQYVKPYLLKNCPKVVEDAKRAAVAYVTSDPKDPRRKPLRTNAIMFLLRHIQPPKERVVSVKPHVVINDTYMGMFYDEVLEGAKQMKTAMDTEHPIASKFL